MMGHKMRILTGCVLTMFLLTLMSACGIEVASTAATQAQLKAKEAEEAKKTMDQLKQKIDEASQAQLRASETMEKSTNP